MPNATQRSKQKKAWQRSQSNEIGIDQEKLPSYMRQTKSSLAKRVKKRSRLLGEQDAPIQWESQEEGR